jgi:hypothetical protein
MSNSLFKKMDEQTFKLVDNLKSSPQFNQASNSLEGLPDEYQKAANQGITYAVTLIPFLILLILFFVNLSVRGRISDKENIIKTIAEMNEAQGKVSRIGAKLVSSISLGNQSSLRSRLSGLSSQFGIGARSISLSDYSQSKAGNLNRTQATINFKKLSTQKLSALLQEFVVSKGVRVQSINLRKGEKTLSGAFSFYHFERAGNTP